MLRIALWITIGLYLASEVALSFFKRSKSAAADARDQGSGRLVWIAVTLGVGAAVAVQWIPITRLHWPDRIVQPVALLLMLAGLTIRWWAIVTLGRYFTTDVATQQQQPVVQTGPYRFVRHPSHSGALIVFLGIHFGGHDAGLAVEAGGCGSIGNPHLTTGGVSIAFGHDSELSPVVAD